MEHFAINYDAVLQALVAIVVVAFILERALALLFEWRPFVKRFHKKGVRTPISLLVALALTMTWHFDALSIIFEHPHSLFLGELITAATIAGGSKYAIKLFQDVLNVKSDAAREQLDKYTFTETSDKDQ